MHILYHCTQGPVYGAQMIDELKRHGYRVGPSHIYPILHEMKKGNLVESKHTVEGGRRRIYYLATEQGEAVLEECKKWLRELVSEILE
ncbi:MAG: helix-turn-helix transcriptional regulator [Syntrophothermus sp.]|uniref:PadR family transcriptional regulator n=1 Tax=Syntrophothermus sp. TaxID=2736299 RepID=UPI00257B913D|nr:helix-turn-helix transcriptional regulator [Syntrophothermus sp.]NSW84529.1 helix-turn-helix transcriptional regulator [Syntrophothermus sp.]